MLRAHHLIIVPAVLAATVTLAAPAAHADAAAPKPATVAADVSTRAEGAGGDIPDRYCGTAKGGDGSWKATAPTKVGQYLYAGATKSCPEADMWNFRSVESHISQYRGLGIWRAKAREITRKNGSAAFRVAHSLEWKCSGGSQLYRTATFSRVGKWLHRGYSAQRRIQC